MLLYLGCYFKHSVPYDHVLRLDVTVVVSVDYALGFTGNRCSIKLLAVLLAVTLAPSGAYIMQSLYGIATAGDCVSRQSSDGSGSV